MHNIDDTHLNFGARSHPFHPLGSGGVFEPSPSTLKNGTGSCRAAQADGLRPSTVVVIDRQGRRLRARQFPISALLGAKFRGLPNRDR